MSALRQAFVDELRDLLDAERQLYQALPKLAEAARNDQLRTAFEGHHAQTEKQIRRLGQVFEAFEEPARGKKCKGMQGLIEEAEELIEEEEGDAALIAAAQKAEHYEIAAYGTLASWAVALGQEGAVQILSEILEEEKETDKKLTVIAQTIVNSQDSQRDEEISEEPKTPAPARSQAKTRTRTRASALRSTRKPKGQSGRSIRKAVNQSSRGPRSKRLRAAARK